MMKGQLNIIGILGGFISLVMFAALTPAAESVIQAGINATNDSTVKILLPLTWVVVGLGILITIVMYTTTTRQQG